jgi:uncharacterized protein (DUF1684 family)
LTDEEFRRDRDAEMRSEESWLTVTGLYWLEEGENAAGSEAGSAIPLPPSAPPRACVVDVRAGRAFLRASPGSGLRVNGADFAGGEAGRPLAADRPGPADLVELGSLRFWIIERAGRLALRLRDLDSPALRAYAGLKWFEPSGAWRVPAAFVPYEEPRKVQVGTAIGTIEEMESPGRIEFEKEGKRYALVAFRSKPDEPFFIVFRDGTSGAESYGAGRFLEAAFEADGSLFLDFNRAVNPPCAYTPWATCPRPPAGNSLELRVEAGERAYAK